MTNPGTNKGHPGDSEDIGLLVAGDHENKGQLLLFLQRGKQGLEIGDKKRWKSRKVR